MTISNKYIIAALIIALSVLSGYAGYSYVRQPEEKIYAFDPGEYFVTNLANSKSLLKSDIMIEISGSSEYKNFNENIFKVRDAIISVLRSKTYDDILDSDAQNNLKNQIKAEVSEKLQAKSVKDIYFNEFVIQ